MEIQEQISVMKRLKEETRPMHDAIEKNEYLARVTSDSIQLDEYYKILEAFWGYYAPLEPLLFDNAIEPWLETFNVAQRLKLPLLKADLLSTGKHSEASIAAISQCDSLPTIDSSAKKLGVLYVLEGSTLGGSVITRHLKSKLGDLVENCTQFYFPYGEMTGPNWKNFAMLVERSCTPDEHDEIVDAAKQTFETLDNWMTKYHSK